MWEGRHIAPRAAAVPRFFPVPLYHLPLYHCTIVPLYGIVPDCTYCTSSNIRQHTRLYVLYDFQHTPTYPIVRFSGFFVWTVQWKKNPSPIFLRFYIRQHTPTYPMVPFSWVFVWCTMVQSGILWYTLVYFGMVGILNVFISNQCLRNPQNKSENK